MRSLMKSTRSRCPVCLENVPADVVRVDGMVVMEKCCPQHGTSRVVLAKDPRFYHLSHGSTGDGCCGGGGCGGDATTLGVGADPFDTLSTCIALIEIVDSCNLTCPTCYAASPFGIGTDLKYTPFDDVVRRIEKVTSRKGYLDILQLSGGEPTLHPEFLRVLAWALDHPKIGYVLVNTNAVRLATDEPFRKELAALRERYRVAKKPSFELYVQFDGVQEAGQRELRGADLRATRQRAIDACGALGVPTTLAMVVNDETLPHVGETLRFGLARRHVRGITFQPVFTSGRIESGASVAPISVGDVILALSEQASDTLGPEDFTPLPCGDPNCHTISYLLRSPFGTQPLSRLINIGDVQGFLKNRVDYRLEDLAQCGCETEPLGDIIKSFEVSPESPFRIFIKPFMDAHTFDQDRIDRCCTHVIRADGSLDSFCRHYLNAGRTAAVPLTLGAT